MKIYIGSDHAGFELKEKLKPYIEKLGHELLDKGPFAFDKDDDYTDYVQSVARDVAGNTNSRGVFIGGTGQGEAIAANRIKGVRCALFYGVAVAKQKVDIDGRESSDPYEIVKLSRLHNDSNILSLSARFLSEEEAQVAVKVWLETQFSGNERHMRRINKLEY